MKLNHLLIPYLALLAFLFGGIAVSGGVGWYETLSLPPWHPSASLIALIWAVIYVCGAWSLVIVWNETPHDRMLSWIMGGFGVSTVLNLVWSVVFFYQHWFIASIGCALLLAISVLVLMTLVSKRSRSAALLLAPYTVWVFFAAYLNYAVMLLNS